jgi:hypothetical protein
MAANRALLALAESSIPGGDSCEADLSKSCETLDLAVKLPSFFSDHMILQRGIPIRVWGSADAGDIVRANYKGRLPP